MSDLDIDVNEVVEEIEQAEVETTEQPKVELEAKKEEPVGDTFIDFEKPLDEQKDVVKARMGKDYRRLKENERRLADAEKKNREYEEKLAELNKPREVAPPTEDLLYEDPDKAKQQMKAYTDYVNKNAEWQKEQALREQQLNAERARQEQEKLQTFVQKSESAGIKQAELGNAASVVQNYLNEDVQGYLMDHEFGPQVLMQLAKNPIELSEIANLNPFQAGAKLDKMAQAFKPSKVSKAPPPDESIKGSGAASDDGYGGLLEGGTFS